MIAGPKLFAQTDPSNIDVQLFRNINNAQTRFKTSLIGVSDNSAYPILVAAPLSLAAYGMIADQNEKFESGVLLGTSEILAYSIGYILKEGVRRERPYEALTDVHTNHLDSADPYSFPSGHSTGVFALATLLTLRYPKPEVYIPAFAWAGLVGYGRVYFGLHYPSDVLAGALIGAGSAYLVYKCQGKILPIVYKLIGRKESENVSAIVVPNNGGALMNITVKF
ncbi:MAG: phosphatase PAP2 family protein [Bacteroidota bacterium]